MKEEVCGDQQTEPGRLDMEQKVMEDIGYNLNMLILDKVTSQKV